MAKEKRSFFERLTGAVRVSDEDERNGQLDVRMRNGNEDDLGDLEQAEGQLVVDVYQTPSDIIIKTMVPGVRPEDLDINITRDMVTVKCRRETERTISDGDYFHRELYWGSFSRTIMLPQEIEIDGAEAVEKHGLLIIKLPKLDKNRQTKIKVKNNG